VQARTAGAVLYTYSMRRWLFAAYAKAGAHWRCSTAHTALLLAQLSELDPRRL
jgi:hypothetical protein